jgi:penicillin-binding protein 1A
MLRWILYLGVFGVLLGVAGVVGVYYYLAPQLPDSASLKEVQLQVPLRVYSRDRKLIGEFGEKRRIPVTYEEVPEVVEQAFLAAEDARFYAHPGVDYQGLMRAGWQLLRTGERTQGGSTITMQVARNFFLTREKTYTRKLNEILLALKIERELSKHEILVLYLNKIYLGQRAYGVGAAAQVYYGTGLSELDLAQVAMIAGMPKAPSKSNPVTNPERALVRRDYVLGRMRELGFIDDGAYRQAKAEPVTARLHAASPSEVDAPYVAEMVRSEVLERFGEDAYVLGLSVYTTVDSGYQTAAADALRSALLAYDRRHGWRGAEARLELETTSAAERRAWLLTRGKTGNLLPALVLEIGDKSARVMLADDSRLELGWDAMRWARPYINENARGGAPGRASDILAPGDVVRVIKTDEGWALAQVPGVQGAFIALDPRNGAILALVGGFDFYASKFNRVTQAERQPGSGFKPVLYSAALEKGYTPATLINDAPIVLADVSLEGDWRPQNYSRKFYGPTRLREALYKSRNLVSIRLLRDIGVDYARDYAGRFGFDPDSLPRNLSLALGTATVTPRQMAAAFAIFANGGYRVRSHLIDRIEDPHGTALYQQDYPVAPPPGTDPNANPVEGASVTERVLSEQNVYLMRTMLRDVVRVGTGRKVSALGRKDLGGKTGTTNDQVDAWFTGFNSQLVATAWVGFDQVRPLGRKEVGGVAALPMWMGFARSALDGVPEQDLVVPEGIVSARIDRRTGLRVADSASREGTMVEVFREELLPQVGGGSNSTYSRSGDGSKESLF